MHTRRQVILQLLGLAACTRTRALSAENPLPPTQTRRSSVPLVDDQGQVTSRYDASALYFAEDLGGGVTLDMGLIPGGAFEMGSISNVPIPPLIMWEQPVHQVSVKPFSLGVFPITLGQWKRVATFPQITLSLGFPIAGRPDSANQLPIDDVSYGEAQEFIQRLQVYTGRPYRFPSEAEWEYACRAGTTTKYHFGDGISLQVANYNDGIVRPLGLTPVGSKQAPNRFGLHDMHGSVLEWCADWVHERYDDAPMDGSAWTYAADSYTRIGRGGMFLWNADSARSAARDHENVMFTAGGKGLRLALDVPSGLYDPRIRDNAVVSAASGLVGPLAPGEIITILGNNIGPQAPAFPTLDERGLVSAALAGTRVLFDGVPAPLLYVSAGQVNAVVPYSVAGHTSTQIILDSQGQTSAPISVPVVESSPALFTTDASGQGQGAIVNQDGSINSANRPAQTGSVVSIFATGEGQTNPPGVDGKPAGSPLPVPLLPVQVFIGDFSADIQYVGGAPGEIAGVLQINALIPAGIGSGPQPAVLRIGQASSPPGVFVMIG